MPQPSRHPVVSKYRMQRRVQFYETDTAGLVHFSWFFRYMEEAEHALWRSAGLSIAPADAKIGFPRVAASFDFHNPLKFEDEFEISLSITAISKKTINYQVHIIKNDIPIASGKLTVACVTKQTGRPMKAVNIPKEIVEHFQVAETPNTDQ